MSSIPLVALASQPAPSPIDRQAKIMQLKSLMNANALAPGQQQLQQGQEQLQQQQIQGAQLANQQTQQQVAQTAAINDSYKRAVTVDPTTGTPKFDTDELSRALAQSGHGSAIPSILENITKYDAAHTDLLSKQTALQTEAADAMGNVGAAIKASNYDPRLTNAIIQHALQQPNLQPQQAQQYQQMAQQIQQNPAVVKQIADNLIASSPEQRKLAASEADAAARKLSADTGAARLAGELDPTSPLHKNPEGTVTDKDRYVQGQEDYRASLARQATNQNEVAKAGLAALQKQADDYGKFVATANSAQSNIAAAKTGDELAASLGPLATALLVTSANGVHRVNTVEMDAAGKDVGSLGRRLDAALAKAGKGTLPAETIAETQQLIQRYSDAKFNSYQNGAAYTQALHKLDPKQTPILNKDGSFGAGAPTAPSSAGSTPSGATHTGIGSADKKRHWLDANGNDLGIVQ